MTRTLAVRVPAARSFIVVLVAVLGFACPVRSAENNPMPDWQITGVHGETIAASDFEQSPYLVVAFLGTECPLAKLYARTLNQIQEEYRSEGISIVAVMSNRQDSLQEIAAYANRSELRFPIGKDLGNEVADAIQADRTPEVVVYDASRQLRYRGRIDDQYGIGTILDKPRRNDLQIAIDELLAGESVSVPRTEAVGCLIGRRSNPEGSGNSVSSTTSSNKPSVDSVTFHEHVAPILNKHCVECHRAGEIGPFALQDFDEVAGWADMIVETTSDRRMPPWHAGDASTMQFRNERKLTPGELETLRKWAENGTPQGRAPETQRLATELADATESPSAEKSSPGKNNLGWQLPGKPDHVFPITQSPIEVPATGEVKYRYYRVDPGFKRDVWAKAMELRPGNRAVVHHILVFARDPKSKDRLHAERGYLDGYVPGYRVEPFPQGYAKKIPAGSELIFQVHYTPTGVAEEDLSEFAIMEIDESDVTHEVHTNSGLNVRLKIPPGESNYGSEAISPRLPAGAELLALMPHMHVRGKSFRFELQTPQGLWSKLGLGEEAEPRVLLDVPRYDFNWQTAYLLAKPLSLPGGGRLICRATFDNSEANLSNPDPTATVRWGDQTWDEMMIGYYHYALSRSASGL
jgi:peroxiredoxin